MHSVKKFVHNRPRLALTFALGLAASFVLPGSMDWMTRALIGWNVGVWMYLLLIGWLMTCANHESVNKIAMQEDESAVAVLVILSLSATASLVAIVFQLANMKGMPEDIRFLKYAFTGVTVLGSWCLLAMVFTFHYALLFYRSPRSQRALRFPDDEQHPDYWDFLYFSFTIAMAVQTSDVSIMSRAMRKTVLAQSLLSFLFNVAILGFSINIAAGLVGA
ncbi:DUF1345 domain-containing protein [Undibacterium sp. Jales W-56]|uniref:DUF1345 domain-containing protein n=1 Tax=Undibacterium sp. Jales W-56 TaxID=2897325 RepID=UPI0021CE68DA|nr:DUF1345 domain-containing protein [Undibacterium sp. Jales W-56]MCU6435735.1 DUF1345 domain-containing protein [Undibacterium sp. Jales W-56]